MDEALHAGVLCVPCDPRRSFDVDGVERLVIALPVQAHRIYHANSPSHGRAHQRIVVDVRPHKVERTRLTTPDRPAAFAMSRGNPHGNAPGSETANDLLTEESGAAKYRDFVALVHLAYVPTIARLPFAPWRPVAKSSCPAPKTCGRDDPDGPLIPLRQSSPVMLRLHAAVMHRNPHDVSVNQRA